MDKFRAIGTKPSYTRLAASKTAPPPVGVDREMGAGVIHGMSVVTRGEALGHMAWIDSEFLDAVASSADVKSRFTHPGLSSDGLGTVLGRMRGLGKNGDLVRGDLHFVASAHRTPDGDLATYVMDFAEESPDLAGLSIVFERDIGAEQRFAAEHTDEEGYFKSPDEDNIHNYGHFRLAKLVAIDVVDDPAANPDGMFSSGHGTLEAIESGLEYALGLREEAPEAVMLGVDPYRAREFWQGFCDRHALAVTRKEKETNMGDEQIKEKTPDVEAIRREVATEGQARLDALRAAFPDNPDYMLEQFSAGATVEQAKAAYTDVLRTQLAELESLRDEQKAKIERLEKQIEGLKASQSSGATPVRYGASGDGGPPDFLAAAKQLAKEEGISNRDAMRRLAHEDPEGHRAWVRAQQGR